MYVFYAGGILLVRERVIPMQSQQSTILSDFLFTFSDLNDCKLCNPSAIHASPHARAPTPQRFHSKSPRT